MIKKTIHYCWFGNVPKPNLVKKCISSWKLYLPNWEIIEWNEKNININKCPKYVRQAYKQKMWAFVSDYIRIIALNTYGGIYFDTDMELIKSPESLLAEKLILCFECDVYINAAFMYSNPNNEILNNITDYYKSTRFVVKGELKTTPIPVIITNIILKQKSLKLNGKYQAFNNLIIYPSDYFYPFNPYNKQRQTGITNNTVALHHFSGSWMKDSNNKMFYWKYLELLRKIKRRIKRILTFSY